MDGTMALQGKTALVTGAGSGIGRAVAIAFARAGAAVACVARGEDAIQQTCMQIAEFGGQALALPADVSDFGAMQQRCDAAEKHFGGIDLVFAAAGVSVENSTVEHSDPLAWRRTLEVNLVGAFVTAKTAIPALKRSGGGHMIFVGSGMGHRAAATRSAYACSKAGLHMLVRVLAAELTEDAIAVNELVPGPVLTPFIAGRVDQLRKAAGASEWFKTTQEVVPMALFMATQPQPGPTGQTFSLARREL